MGCDSSPCHVNQGDSITYEVDFIAGKNALRLRWIVYVLQIVFTISAAVDTNEMRLAVNATIFGVQNPGKLTKFRTFGSTEFSTSFLWPSDFPFFVDEVEIFVDGDVH